ncbi:hypothetical protein I4641_15235 [Waterburya agarophytonicola K14]|uniref:DUF6816 domain-containing protein n=1 Tax=Waterburya agarophytonicola KI4 TaxID=2874699 RepID=A0A964FIC1_9CYAN|nr:hypothetical protein [Waterburya agarophytonicola]MCC0178334.1 hypothetical protein [Waterburya agarophytonicola KI4]
MREKVTLNYQPSTIKDKLSQVLLVFLILFSFSSSAVAATIQERIQQYPQWNSKPSVQLAQGDLEYPEWMAGTWNVESTLIEKIAPLAPDIVSPGFEDNDDYIDKAIAFQVRFGKEYFTPPTGLLSVFKSSQPIVVADRGFNGQNIAETYLGEDNVYRVKTDPDNPNQQITFLRGERKLISKVTGRSREMPSDKEFIATEVTQQLFRSPERLYLNEVETTSDYHLLDSGNIEAEQITAIYLSPQDPDYFTAGDRPVALYRYHLSLNTRKSLTLNK